MPTNIQNLINSIATETKNLKLIDECFDYMIKTPASNQSAVEVIEKLNKIEADFNSVSIKTLVVELFKKTDAFLWINEFNCMDSKYKDGVYYNLMHEFLGELKTGKYVKNFDQLDRNLRFFKSINTSSVDILSFLVNAAFYNRSIIKSCASFAADNEKNAISVGLNNSFDSDGKFKEQWINEVISFLDKDKVKSALRSLCYSNLNDALTYEPYCIKMEVKKDMLLEVFNLLASFLKNDVSSASDNGYTALRVLNTGNVGFLDHEELEARRKMAQILFNNGACVNDLYEKLSIEKIASDSLRDLIIVQKEKEDLGVHLQIDQAISKTTSIKKNI